MLNISNYFENNNKILILMEQKKLGKVRNFQSILNSRKYVIFQMKICCTDLVQPSNQLRLI